MRYKIDHDLHIHSYISPCAGHDPRQTAEAILAYGLTAGFGLVCVTDHIWDKDGPGNCPLWRGDGLDFDKGREILPLPQSKKCRFLFGIEADMDHDGNLALTEKDYGTFDFIIVAPSHMHIFPPRIEAGDTRTVAEIYKEAYKKRIRQILAKNLPFEKCGIAHFTTSLTCTKDPDGVFDAFSDGEYEEIFGEIAARGMGVELNLDSKYLRADEETFLHHMRPYFIAKRMGCTFFLGGDSHTPDTFGTRVPMFTRAVEALKLTEDDKFPFVTSHLAGQA